MTAMSASVPPLGSVSIKSTPANISGAKPRHSGMDLFSGATILIGTFEMERIPLIESKIIFTDAERAPGVRKTIDECNASHISRKID